MSYFTSASSTSSVIVNPYTGRGAVLAYRDTYTAPKGFEPTILDPFANMTTSSQSTSKVSRRWDASSDGLLNSPIYPKRMSRQAFLTLFGKTRKTSAKDARGSKKKSESKGAWKEWKPNIKRSKVTAPSTASSTSSTSQVDDNYDVISRMAEITAHKVSNPYAAQAQAWAARAAAKTSSVKVSKGKGSYTIPAEGWVAPTYTEVVKQSTARVYVASRYVPVFVQSAEERSATAAYMAARSAYKAKRRKENRNNFTLEAVLGLITATRKGTAKAGGVGFTAFTFTNVAVMAAVADVFNAIATTVGIATTTTRARRRVRKTMNVNQTIARRERVKRQRRNKAVRHRHLKPQTKHGSIKTAAKQERRKVATSLAAALAAQKAAAKGVITRYAKCAALRAQNNNIVLANGTEAPILKATKQMWRQNRREEEQQLSPAIRFRRQMAEGNYNRRKDGQAAFNYRAREVAALTQTEVEQKAATKAYLDGIRFMNQFLNRSETLDVTLSTEVESKAAEIVTAAKNRYGAGNLQMSMRMTAAQIVAKLWPEIDSKDITLDTKLTMLHTAYMKQTRRNVQRPTVESYLAQASEQGLIDASAHYDPSIITNYHLLCAKGLNYKEALKQMGITAFELRISSQGAKSSKTQGVNTEKSTNSNKKKDIVLPALSNRHQVVADLWATINAENASLKSKLEQLATSYSRETASNKATHNTVCSYLAAAYMHGLCGDVSEVLSDIDVSAVFALKQEGLSLANISKKLNITYFEVFLALLQTKPQEVIMVSTPQTGYLPLDTVGPVKFLKSSKQLGCIPVCTLKHKGAKAIDLNNDPVYVVISRVNKTRCNANAHFGHVLDNQTAAEERWYAPDDSNKPVPVSNFLGFDKKLESGWSGSSIGATPARIVGNFANICKSSYTYTDAAYTNVKAAQHFGRFVSHHLNYASLINGQHDIYDRVDGRQEVGSEAATVRGLIRNAIYTGKTTWVNTLAKHGNDITIHNNLEGLMNTHQGIVDKRDGTVIGDHYIMVVARANKIRDLRRKEYNEFKGQIRPYCDFMTIYYVPVDIVESLFDFDTPRNDNNFFSFLEKGKDLTVTVEKKLRPNGIVAATTSAATSAATTAPKTTSVATSSLPRKTTKVTTTTAAVKSTDASTPTSVESTKQVKTAKSDAVTAAPKADVNADGKFNLLNGYSDEIKSLYKAILNPLEGNRAKNFYSVDDVLEAFVLGQEDYLKAMSKLCPFASNETLYEYVAGTNKKVSLAQKAAYAMAYYLRGFIAQPDENGVEANPVAVNAMDILEHDWRYSEVEGFVTIFQEIFDSASARTARNKRTNAARSAKDILRLEVIDDKRCLLIDGQVAFVFGNDNTVYDWRGRAFSNAIIVDAYKKNKQELQSERVLLADKTTPLNPYKVDVKVVKSMGMFFYFMWLVYLPMVANWSGSAGLFSNTMQNLKPTLEKLKFIFKMTTDNVQDQNGAVQHILLSTYAPFMAKTYSPFNTGSNGIALWAPMGNRPAKALEKRYIGSKAVDLEEFIEESVAETELNLADVLEQVMHLAHSKYGIDFHYSRAQFVAGSIGHVNIKLVMQHAPNLYSAMKSYLGCGLEAYHVIANTIKASKGLKRVTLPMAQSSPVDDAAPSAWAMYGQEVYAEGWLNEVGYAPSHVGPPGMSLFLGTESQKPVTHPLKRVSETRNSFHIVEDCPFDFSYSTVEGICETEWSTESTADGWTVLSPTRNIQLQGTRTEIICGLHDNQPLVHQGYCSGVLTEIRWRIADSIDNKSEVLEVEYIISTTERDMKSRQVNKCQYLSTNDMVLFNELNADLSKDTCRVVGLHLQDAMKMDTLYAWLFIIANTAYYNEVESDTIAKLRKMIAAVNVAVTGDQNLVGGKPMLVIEPAAVAAGLYQPLQDLFHATFAQTRWLLWPESGTMGEMMYRYYGNKVVAGDWHTVANPLATLPELSDIQGRLIVIAEDETITPTTPVLAFGLDDKGNVLEYAQRGVMYLSTKEAQLYNVELFESSTVQESVSTSTQLLSYIKALRVVAGDTELVHKEQRRLIDLGQDKTYRALVMHSALNGDTLSSDFNVATIIVDEASGQIGFSSDDATDKAVNLLEERLLEANIDLDKVDIYREDLFTIFAHASRDIVFTFNCADGPVALWLPALLSFTKLTSNNDERRDFVSTFFYDVLIPCVEVSEDTNSRALEQTRGMLVSLCRSKHSKTFLNGGSCATAKRIGVPNIPLDEAWVLISHDSNHLYQDMIRSGIPVDNLELVREGLYSEYNRAPMPLGAIKRIRLIEEVYVDGVYVGQRKVAFEGEEADNELLLYNISPVQLGIDPMSVYLDGGDFDGDGTYATLLKYLGKEFCTDMQLVYDLRSTAIGMGMFDAKCDSYMADHYAIKSFKDATLTLTNHAKAVRKAVKTAKDYINYNYQAYSIQCIGVGVMYGVYMFSEIICGLVHDLHSEGLDKLITDPDCKKLLKADVKTMAMCVAEIYEIMLGGYSKGAEMLWNGFLKPLLYRKPFICDEANAYFDAFLDETPNFYSPIAVSCLVNLLNKKQINATYVYKSLKDSVKAIAKEKDVNVVTAVELISLNLEEVLANAPASKETLKAIEAGLNLLKVRARLYMTVKELGANLNRLDEFLTALTLMKDYYAIRKHGDQDSSSLCHFAFTVFELNRGRYSGHGDLYNSATSFLDSVIKEPKGLAVLNKNMSLYSLYKFDKIMCDVYSDNYTVNETWLEEDFNYFLAKLRPTATPEVSSVIHNLFDHCNDDTEDEDNDNYNDGGSNVSDSHDDDGDDDGGAALDVAEPEAEESEETQSARDYYSSLSYKELQQECKTARSRGITTPKLTSKKEVLIDFLMSLEESDAIESVEDETPSSTDTPLPVEETEMEETQDNEESTVYTQDGLYVQQYFCQDEGIYDKLRAAIKETFEEGEKASFTSKSYSYTCAGDYFWVWSKGKGKYLNTQPSGSAIVKMPTILKETAEEIVAKLDIFEGYEAQVCLINRYEGAQKLNLHVDKDEEIDAPIVSFSFGQTGIFQIDGEKYEVGDGDLIVFYGNKRFALHGYEGNEGGEGVRYNVTVRMVKPKPTVDIQATSEETEMEETQAQEYEWERENRQGLVEEALQTIHETLLECPTKEEKSEYLNALEDLLHNYRQSSTPTNPVLVATQDTEESKDNSLDDKAEQNVPELCTFVEDEDLSSDLCSYVVDNDDDVPLAQSFNSYVVDDDDDVPLAQSFNSYAVDDDDDVPLAQSFDAGAVDDDLATSPCERCGDKQDVDVAKPEVTVTSVDATAAGLRKAVLATNDSHIETLGWSLEEARIQLKALHGVSSRKELNNAQLVDWAQYCEGLVEEQAELAKRQMKVVNIHKGGTGHYIGRPGKGKKGSALANNAIVGKHGTREECYDKYREWLWDKVQQYEKGILAEEDKPIFAELELIRKTRPDLVCFCAPKKCHGEIIIEVVDYLDQQNQLKVISGGQYGADLGGLLGATKANIPTGGTAPKGYKTERGTNLQLKDFGLVEDNSSNYVARTIKNINDADVTIAFQWNVGSAGTARTVSYCHTGTWGNTHRGTNLSGHRPVLCIQHKELAKAVAEVKEFILKTRAKVVNIAGNRESKAPGLQQFVTEVMSTALTNEAPANPTVPLAQSFNSYAVDDDDDVPLAQSFNSYTVDNDDDVPLAQSFDAGAKEDGDRPCHKKVLPDLSELRSKRAKAKKVIPDADTLRKQKAEKEKAKQMSALTITSEMIEQLNKNLNADAYTREVNTLSSSQLGALNAVLEGKNVILTGVGGGGKSYTSEVIRHVYDVLKLPYVVVGSTGTSVMNVQGDGTYNSLFGLSIGFADSDAGRISSYADFCNLKSKCRDSRFVKSAKAYNGKRPILIVVDEVSMLDNRLLFVVYTALKEENINAQWLLVGDPMQFLPVSGDLFFEPVSIQNDRKQVVSSMSSFSKELNFVEINLSENIRANGDVAWVDCLNQMRLDQLQLNHPKGNLIKDRFNHSIENEAPEDAIHLFFNNAGVKRHNKRKTKQMIEAGAKYKTYKAFTQSKYGKDWFKRRTNDGLETETITIFDPIEEEMTFCIGMPVMIRKNITVNNELIAANGTRGFVTALGKDSISVRVESTNKIVMVEATTLPVSKDKSGQPIGTFQQIPAHPCFAMTFHKVQGLTLDCPGVIHAYFVNRGRVCPIAPKYANSLYVPFSRFTSSKHVYIATSTEFNEKLSPKQMWRLLVDSYHTCEKALDWVENIS